MGSGLGGDHPSFRAAALAIAAGLAACSKYDAPAAMQAELTRIRHVCAQEKTDQARTLCAQTHLEVIRMDREQATARRMAAGAALQNYAAQRQAAIAQQQATAAARAPTAWNYQTHGSSIHCNGY